MHPSAVRPPDEKLGHLGKLGPIVSRSRLRRLHLITLRRTLKRGVSCGVWQGAQALRMNALREALRLAALGVPGKVISLR